MGYYREREAGGSGLDKILGRLAGRCVALRAHDRAAARRRTAPGRRRRAGGADPRRDRHRQGTGGARAALRRPAPRASPSSRLNCGALPPQLDRGRAVRLREGRLHRRARAQGRAGRRRPKAARCFSTRSARPTCRRRSKLLKLLEEKRFRRLGSVRDQQVNVRIVSATHRPLEQTGARRAVPRRPVLPPAHRRDRRAAAARARRRHRSSWRATSWRTHAQRYRRGAHALTPRRRSRAAAPRLAGQRARIAQRHGAGGADERGATCRPASELPSCALAQAAAAARAAVATTT